MNGGKMNKRICRKLTIIGILSLVILSLCACKAKTARQLKSEARAEHGHAKVISKYTSDNYSYVVLKDKEQGFTYTVASGLHGISIDGSSLGGSYTYDDFNERLLEYCYGFVRRQVDELCSQYGASYDPVECSITVNNPDEAADVSEGCAKVLVTHDKKNRLNGKIIIVYDTKGEILGDVMFPECIYIPR